MNDPGAVCAWKEDKNAGSVPRNPPAGVHGERSGTGRVSGESLKTKYPSRLRVFLSAAVSAVVAATSCARHDARVIEERVCVLHDSVVGWGYAESTRQIAYVAHVGRQYMVVANGVESEPYDSVGSFEFSPRGTQSAYVAYARGKQFLVLDGKGSSLFCVGKVVDGGVFGG